MKEKVKALWKLCFEDSDEFIELYFRLRYSDEINIAIENEDQVISALQMIPYPMTFCGHTVETSYISGACTHPDFRGKSIMRELLLRAFTRMSHKGVLFSTLIPAEPWLFDYYERMGYASVFGYSTEKIAVPCSAPSKNIVVKSLSEYQGNIDLYLNKKLSERPCCIQHPSTDLNVIMADSLASHGEIGIALKENKILGIAFSDKEGDSVTINELFAESRDAEQSLLYHIGQWAGCNQLTRFVPPTDEFSKQALGMARIIHAQEVLQLYAAAFPDEEMQLELSDEQVSTNNGYYSLRQGECAFSTVSLSGAHTKLTISELTKRILSPLHPYMSLMMN